MHGATLLSAKKRTQISSGKRPRTVFPYFLGEVYLLESQKDFLLRENQSLGRDFPHLCKILSQHRETFLFVISSIQAQLFTGLLKARFRKNPAVAAAGS